MYTENLWLAGIYAEVPINHNETGDLEITRSWSPLRRNAFLLAYFDDYHVYNWAVCWVINCVTLADDPCDNSMSNSGDTVLAKLMNRQTMACNLKFETPCILRKRKRRSPRATRRIDVRFGTCEYKDSHLMTSESESSPKNESPFTPSRVSGLV